MLEQLLIDHCAPTLAGLKTASLFRCLGTEEQRMEEKLSRLNAEMAAGRPANNWAWNWPDRR